MNTSEVQRRWIEWARSIPPDDRVPYAFEKRVMARVFAQPQTTVREIWGRVLWRACIPCVAIMLISSVLDVFSARSISQEASLGVDLESAVLAPLDELSQTW